MVVTPTHVALAALAANSPLAAVLLAIVCDDTVHWRPAVQPAHLVLSLTLTHTAQAALAANSPMAAALLALADVARDKRNASQGAGGGKRQAAGAGAPSRSAREMAVEAAQKLAALQLYQQGPERFKVTSLP